MKKYVMGTPEFELQTTVMACLPHAVHPVHGDWRTKADSLIDQLREFGYEIRKVGEPSPSLKNLMDAAYRKSSI